MPTPSLVEELDPDRDYATIHRAVFKVDFDWETRRALELAMFHTFAIPAIAQILDRTGKFAHHGQQRYDDTVSLLRDVARDGPATPCGHAAIRRINQVHRPYGIPNSDYLYVLTTFVVVPVRWISRYGWRDLAEGEVRACVRYYRELGRLMGIRHIPETYDGFARYLDRYEHDHRRFTAANHRLAVSLAGTMAAWLPRPVRPLARLCITAALGPSLRDALGLPEPGPVTRACVHGALRARAVLVRSLRRARARCAWLRTAIAAGSLKPYRAV